MKRFLARARRGFWTPAIGNADSLLGGLIMILIGVDVALSVGLSLGHTVLGDLNFFVQANNNAFGGGN